MSSPKTSGRSLAGASPSMRRQPGDDERRPRVVFIGGFARSGSTLLDCMVGQTPGFVSTGEIKFIWTRGLQRNEPCGCGEPFNACPFWKAVLEKAFGSNDRIDPEGLAALHASIERTRYVPELSVEALRRRAIDARLEAYASVLESLYAAIRSVSGCDVVVDSSKDPLHGFTLAAMSGVDLRVVHLVRDSRAVAFSHQRHKARTPGAGGAQLRRLDPKTSALGWDVANSLMHLLRAKAASNSVRVRYEDLVGAPTDVIRSVTASAGHPYARLDFIEPGGVHLGPNHTVSGNPSRFQRGLRELRMDAEWETGMERRDRDVVTALTWPLLARYGYVGSRGLPD